MCDLHASITQPSLLALLLVASCGQSDPSIGRARARLPVPEPMAAAAVAPPRPVEVALPVDPYEGWESWSESLVAAPCESDEDCEPDRTGRPTFCQTKGHATGYCKPKWLNRKQQRIQRENQRLIVDAICEPPSWYKNERDGEGKACWRFRPKTAMKCQRKRWCNPEKLHRFLRLVALRESTWDHQTDHHLNPDRIANAGSYRRHLRRGTYEGNQHFYDGLTRNHRGKILFARRSRAGHIARIPQRFCRPMERGQIVPAESQNPHDRNCDGVPDRWQVGYGWYGTNAANFVMEWDVEAPPEVLSRRVPATLAVLRRARTAWRKLEGGVDCRDAEGVPYTAERMRAGQTRDYTRETRISPTWWTVHRAVWGGEICPSPTGKKTYYERAFAARARKIGLDADEQIPLQMLGAPIPRDEQWSLVRELEKKFAPVFPKSSS
jgi:hypothetical protein